MANIPIYLLKGFYARTFKFPHMASEVRFSAFICNCHFYMPVEDMCGYSIQDNDMLRVVREADVSEVRQSLQL